MAQSFSSVFYIIFTLGWFILRATFWPVGRMFVKQFASSLLQEICLENLSLGVSGGKAWRWQDEAERVRGRNRSLIWTALIFVNALWLIFPPLSVLFFLATGSGTEMRWHLWRGWGKSDNVFITIALVLFLSDEDSQIVCTLFLQETTGTCKYVENWLLSLTLLFYCDFCMIIWKYSNILKYFLSYLVCVYVLLDIASQGTYIV